MPDVILLAIITVLVALVFDFINGFHDAANSISTIVATKVLSPLQAVLMAAFWNFVGAFIFGVAIAKTVGSGIITKDAAIVPVILAALMGAIIWNLITWYKGIPSSSSHALVGGLIGAALVHLGTKSLILPGILKIVAFIFLAPLLGMAGAIVFSVIVFWVSKSLSPHSVNSWFKRLQLISASGYSLGHGTNDAQKTMGVIAAALFSAGLINSFRIDTWVILAAHLAIALGTFFGGWRIVKTMGHKLTKLRPVHGFCAESGGALVLLGSAELGIPVSTTHVISGSIIGVGTATKPSQVKWKTAKGMLAAWILTIPMSALFAAASFMLLSLFL